jgi:hypothetical protein
MRGRARRSTACRRPGSLAALRGRGKGGEKTRNPPQKDRAGQEKEDWPRDCTHTSVCGRTRRGAAIQAGRPAENQQAPQALRAGRRLLQDCFVVTGTSEARALSFRRSADHKGLGCCGQPRTHEFSGYTGHGSEKFQNFFVFPNPFRSRKQCISSGTRLILSSRRCFFDSDRLASSHGSTERRIFEAPG